MFRLNYDFASDCSAGEVALVMLPGAGMNAQDFKTRGFVEAIRLRGLSVDTIMVDAGTDDYIPPMVGKLLGNAVIDPLHDGGYRRIWLAGISLGAYGAMRLLQERADDIEGMLLLSPFLSTRGTIAKVLRAGGLGRWSPLPGEREGDDESLLCWLKDNLGVEALRLNIYLGWGEEDRYADTSKLLAEYLPRDKVFCIPGDHDWRTWSTLWNDMLDAASFAFSCSRTGCAPQ